jgi:hypothetical protein
MSKRKWKKKKINLQCKYFLSKLRCSGTTIWYIFKFYVCITSNVISQKKKKDVVLIQINDFDWWDDIWVYLIIQALFRVMDGWNQSKLKIRIQFIFPRIEIEYRISLYHIVRDSNLEFVGWSREFLCKKLFIFLFPWFLLCLHLKFSSLLV